MNILLFLVFTLVLIKAKHDRNAPNALTTISPHICSPLNPNPLKISSLQGLHRDQSAPIYFWHIQKAGGTSFCELMRNTYHKVRGIEDALRSPNCNNLRISDDIVINPNAWRLRYFPQRYIYVAIEPSLELWAMAGNKTHLEEFPLHYHNRLSTQILLNSSFGARREEAWNSMVHVIGEGKENLFSFFILSLLAISFQEPTGAVRVCLRLRVRRQQPQHAGHLRSRGHTSQRVHGRGS